MPGDLDGFLKKVIEEQKSGGAPAGTAAASSGGGVGEELPPAEVESDNFQGLTMVEWKQSYLDNIQDMLLDQVAGIKNPGLLVVPFSVPMRHYTTVGELGGFETSTTIGNDFAIKLPPLVEPNDLVPPQNKYFPYNLNLSGDDKPYVTFDPLRAIAFSHFAYTLSAFGSVFQNFGSSYTPITKLTSQFKGQQAIYPGMIYEIVESLSGWSGNSLDPMTQTIKIGGSADSPLIQYMYDEDPFGTGTNFSHILNKYLLSEEGQPVGKKDATFTIYKPFGEVAYQEEAAEVIGLSDPVKINAHYNYYLQPYEKLITKESQYIDLRMYGEFLPNIYGMIYDEQNESDVYYDQWALNSNKIYPAGEPLKFKSNFKEYFNKFAQFLFGGKYTEEEQSSTTVAFQTNTKKYSTVGISAYSMPYFVDEADRRKELFPMYVDVEIPSTNSGEFGAILYKEGVFDDFMQLMMAAFFPRSSNNIVIPPYVDPVIIKRDSFLEIDDNGQALMGNTTDSLFSERLATLSLNSIMGANFAAQGAAALTQNPDDESLTKDFAFLKNNLNEKINENIVIPVIYGYDEGLSETGEPAGSLKEFIQVLKFSSAAEKMETFIRDKVRSVKDIYDGKLAHSEILFYEIVKYRSSSPEAGGTFVQNIFVPNVPNTSVLKYVDTQIKFDKEYYYQIYAHTLVVGTDYKFTGTGFKYQDAPGGVVVSVAQQYSFEYEPDVYLMRVPYSNTYITVNDAVKKGDGPFQVFSPEKLERTYVYDKPPVFPDIEIVPLYAKKDKFLINTNFNIGEYDLHPIFIDDEETATLQKIRMNQKKMKGPITFKSDDFGGTIEVLRLDKKPTSYKDYSPASENRVILLGGQNAFGYMDDTIEPNKTYYYIFRAIDVHGNYSNPSPVYQVRIATADGTSPFLVVNLMYMDELQKEKLANTKDLMKYIKIKPSFLQSYLDQSDLVTAYDSALSLDTSNMVFGNPGKEKDVFGKKFKFRFISKKTGRKFDLNITVKTPRINEKTSKTD